MSRDELLSDLNYVKTMAEEGAQTPLLGGRIGLMWGVLLSFTFFMQWAILTQTFVLPYKSLVFLWLGFAILGGLGSMIFGRQIDTKPGARSVANRVESYVWVMFAFMMASLFIGILLNQILSDGTPQLFDLMVVFGFAGQGLAYGIVAKMSGLKWIYLASLAGFIAATLCFAVYGQLSIYLIGAIAVIFTVIIPSLISLKNEPKNVV